MAKRPRLADASSLIHRLDSLRNQKKYAEALEEIQTVVAAGKNSREELSEIYCMAAIIHFNLDDEDKNLYYLRESLLLNPNNIRVRLFLTDFHIRHGNLEAASAILEEAWTEPDLSDTYHANEDIIACYASKLNRHRAYICETNNDPETAAEFHAAARELSEKICTIIRNVPNLTEKALCAMFDQGRPECIGTGFAAAHDELLAMSRGKLSPRYRQAFEAADRGDAQMAKTHILGRHL